MTDKVVAHWLQKLSKFYWSAETPDSYKVPHYKTGELVGIGRVAMQHPGSFNLTWSYMKGELGTYANHLDAVAFYSKAVKANDHVIDGAPLEEWLTLLNQAEYLTWYYANCSRLPDDIKLLHDSALHVVPKLS